MSRANERQRARRAVTAWWKPIATRGCPGEWIGTLTEARVYVEYGVYARGTVSAQLPDELEADLEDL